MRAGSTSDSGSGGRHVQQSVVEVVRAPPLRIALAKLGAMVFVGALVVLLSKQYFFPWMKEYLAVTHDRAEALRRFEIVMLGAATVVLGLAASAGWLGVRVLRQGQWPLAGAFVLRDTPLRRGRWVRVRGIALIVVAVLFAADAIGLALLPWLLPD